MWGREPYFFIKWQKLSRDLNVELYTQPGIVYLSPRDDSEIERERERERKVGVEKKQTPLQYVQNITRISYDIIQFLFPTEFSMMVVGGMRSAWLGGLPLLHCAVHGRMNMVWVTNSPLICCILNYALHFEEWVMWNAVGWLCVPCTETVCMLGENREQSSGGFCTPFQIVEWNHDSCVRFHYLIQYMYECTFVLYWNCGFISMRFLTDKNFALPYGAVFARQRKMMRWAAFQKCFLFFLLFTSTRISFRSVLPCVLV